MEWVLMKEDIEHKIDILNIVQERDFNKETCEDSYIEAVLLGIETVLKELEKLQKENEELSESHNYIYDAYQDAGKKMFDYQEQLNDSIPKQVIRDEIEKRKKHCTVINSFVIEALEELLGE